MKKIATVIALTCLPALPAAAATMTVVGTGIISSGGYDYTGVFGDVGTLTGQRATLTFVYDTEALPGRQTGSNGSYSYDYSFGSFGVQVFSSATIEVNGYEYEVPGTYNNNAQLRNYPVNTTYDDYYNLNSQHVTNDYANNYYENDAITLHLGTLPTGVISLGDAFSWSGTADTTSWFGLAAYTTGVSGAQYQHRAIGSIALDSLTVTSSEDASLPAVPLPAGAPLILSGLVALFGLRRLKRKAA